MFRPRLLLLLAFALPLLAGCPSSSTRESPKASPSTPKKEAEPPKKDGAPPEPAPDIR